MSIKKRLRATTSSKGRCADFCQRAKQISSNILLIIIVISIITVRLCVQDIIAAAQSKSSEDAESDSVDRLFSFSFSVTVLVLFAI